VMERSTQAAILSFLEGYEPDLIACAAVIGVSPVVLVQARQELEACALPALDRFSFPIATKCCCT